jgi:hypothetical protein
LIITGVPGQTYRVQASNDLTVPGWLTLGSVTIPAVGGTAEVVDQDAFVFPIRYYRLIYP